MCFQATQDLFQGWVIKNFNLFVLPVYFFSVSCFSTVEFHTPLKMGFLYPKCLDKLQCRFHIVSIAFITRLASLVIHMLLYKYQSHCHARIILHCQLFLYSQNSHPLEDGIFVSQISRQTSMPFPHRIYDQTCEFCYTSLCQRLCTNYGHNRIYYVSHPYSTDDALIKSVEVKTQQIGCRN